MTFKDVKCEDWKATYQSIYQIIRNEVQRHFELLESDQLSAYDKEYLRSILGGTASETDIAMSFMNLSRMLHAHYAVAPIIIIDEYDTPIQQGYSLGYYDMDRCDRQPTVLCVALRVSDGGEGHWA